MIKGIKYFSIVILIWIIYSCAVSPLIRYKKISENNNSPKIENINFSTATNISLNKENNLNLNLNDSILKYNDTIFSNYKVFKFIGNPNTNYKISVYSYCDCFGFRKYMFNPEIRIINQNGTQIKIKLDSNNIDYLYTFRPISYNKIWKIEEKLDGDCYLILYSNNKRLQQSIYSFLTNNFTYTGNIVVPIVIPINIKSTLVGNFTLRIDEYK